MGEKKLIIPSEFILEHRVNWRDKEVIWVTYDNAFPKFELVILLLFPYKTNSKDSNLF